MPFRVMELSEELLQRKRREEKEAQDLENMVHSVEQNLHLMTVGMLTDANRGSIRSITQLILLYDACVCVCVCVCVTEASS